MGDDEDAETGDDGVKQPGRRGSGATAKRGGGAAQTESERPERGGKEAAEANDAAAGGGAPAPLRLSGDAGLSEGQTAYLVVVDDVSGYVMKVSRVDAGSGEVRRFGVEELAEAIVALRGSVAPSAAKRTRQLSALASGEPQAARARKPDATADKASGSDMASESELAAYHDGVLAFLKTISGDHPSRGA